MKIRILIVLVMIGSVIAGCSSGTINGKVIANGNKITVFKSPMCGCCEGYINELEKNGFQVEVKEMQDMSSIKTKYNVPLSMQSCHTAVVGNYFIEGHVPIEAVNKMIEEQPDIDGILLPRMPSGSPGMPGPKTETWVIYALSNGKTTEFMKI